MYFFEKLTETENNYRSELENIDIPTGDIYTKYKKDNGNSLSIPNLIKIGNLHHPENLSFPALISIKDTNGIAFEINETNREEIHLCLQYICLQIISSLENSLCKLTIIDPKKMGRNFNLLIKLPRSIMTEIVYDSHNIRECIDYHFDKTISIINECLVHYNDLENYNNGTEGAQPYRLIFIGDFPYGFKDYLDKLNTLIHNGQEAGIMFFISYDPEIKMGMRENMVQEILDQFTILKEFSDPSFDLYKVTNHINSSFYNDGLTLQLDRKDINPDNLNKLIQKNEFLNNQLVEDEPNRGLRIPIGKSSGRTHYFTIGHETENYHAIIGGQPGKGKTVLLNNIIARGAEIYSPDELRFFLLDCAGVGFQEFRDSNHVELLLSSSKVEECTEVIKYIENELNRREVLFREAKVAEIKDYLNKTGKALPRVVCVIDEFHVLFTGSSRTSAYIESILVERVIRIGRKFGVHLVVATQSLGGGVRRSILDNIPLRIAMGMTPDQSAGFLGLKNEAASNLARGVAIYNNQNGSKRANKTVRINYIDSSATDQLISRANESHSDFKFFERKIMQNE